jgi:hypothetical protein
MKSNFIDEITKNNLSKKQKEKLNKYLIESYYETSSELISVRLNPQEKEILKSVSVKKGLSITDLIKVFIIRELYLDNEKS